MKRLRWGFVVVVLASILSACGSGPMSALGPGFSSGAQTPQGHDGTSLAIAAAASRPPTVPVDAWQHSSSPAQDVNVRVYTDPGDLPYLRVATEPQQKLPLEHTHVKAQLTGFVAEVEVTQTYTNPHDQPIEAIYVFPLPENSAVNRMRMVIGKRVIEAQIKKRGEARRIYRRAKRAGYTTALLEQERPNVFTQSVANIEPGKKIDVIIRYVQDLTYDAGQYEFVFPMVVGPRFMPGNKLGSAPVGSGTKADSVEVPDASRISPPIVGKGQRTGHDISIELTADASLAVSGFEVPTHQVVTRKPADGTLHLALAEKKSLPNRDFVLRYRVAGARPQATMFTAEKKGRGGFFSLVLHPPKLDIDSLVGRREIIFVVDVSGSMSGTPLGMCRAAMRRALRQLRPVDTFNILTFAGSTSKAFARPRPANTSNLRQGLKVVDTMRAGGGTYMANAVQAALGDNVAPGRHRYVFFMTDGYVGNEEQIIKASAKFVSRLKKKGQRARVFGFGTGSSVNRHLIDGLSRAGQGLAVYATNREDPARGVNRFFHYIDRAVLTDVKVDWAGLQAKQVFPAPTPDLFASHPLILHGRFTGTPSKNIVVRASAGDEQLSIPVTVRTARSKAAASQVQAALWARTKVSNLEEHLWDGASRSVRREITKLGLEHNLVTRYTSFVAVDASRRVGTGKPKTVVQPVQGPEGVDVDMAGGIRAGSGPSSAMQTASRRPAAHRPSDSRASVSWGADDEMSAPAGPMAPPPASPDTVLYAVDSKRGCGCRLVGAPARSRLMAGWLVATILGLTTVVRRARRQRRRPAPCDRVKQDDWPSEHGRQ